MASDTQAQIDQLTTQVQQVGTDLSATRDKIQAEIDALAAQIQQGNPPDLTGLQAAIAPLDDAVKALGDIQPTPPPAP